MCMYCERRKDVSFGWEQPELPISGNLEEGTHVQIHDYQSAQPEIHITNATLGNGIATIVIPSNFCPVCGKQLGKAKCRTLEQHPKKKQPCPAPLNVKKALSTYRETHPNEEISMTKDWRNKPQTALLHPAGTKEPVYIRMRPHTIQSLKELIHVRNMPDGSILRKYADLTARLLMTIDQNMLVSTLRIVWDTTTGKEFMIPPGINQVVIDAEHLPEADGKTVCRHLMLKTLEAVRRHGLKNPLLNPGIYPESLSTEKAVAEWAKSQLDNITWLDLTLTLWT